MIRLLLIALLLSGCTVKTTIAKLDDGYEIRSKRNALIVVGPDGKVVVDNRGRVSAAEMLFSSLFTDTAKTIEIDVDELKKQSEED